MNAKTLNARPIATSSSAGNAAHGYRDTRRSHTIAHNRTQSLAAPIAILIGITLIIFYACSRLGEDLILLQVYVGLAAFYFWRSQIYAWRATPLTRGLAYGAIFAVLGVYFVLAMTYPLERDFAALAAGLPLVSVLLAPLVLSYARVDVQRKHGSPEALWIYWFWEGNLLIWVWGGIAWFASVIAGSMAGAGFGGVVLIVRAAGPQPTARLSETTGNRPTRIVGHW